MRKFSTAANPQNASQLLNDLSLNYKPFDACTVAPLYRNIALSCFRLLVFLLQFPRRPNTVKHIVAPARACHPAVSWSGSLWTVKQTDTIWAAVGARGRAPASVPSAAGRWRLPARYLGRSRVAGRRRRLARRLGSRRPGAKPREPRWRRRQGWPSDGPPLRRFFIACSANTIFASSTPSGWSHRRWWCEAASEPLGARAFMALRSLWAAYRQALRQDPLRCPPLSREPRLRGCA